MNTNDINEEEVSRKMDLFKEVLFQIAKHRGDDLGDSLMNKNLPSILVLDARVSSERIWEEMYNFGHGIK